MTDIYDGGWESLTEVIAYGFGQVGKKYIELFHHHISVKYIVDKEANRLGNFCNIPIYSLEEMLAKRSNEKIVVFASRSTYSSIKNELIKNNLLEYMDFCKFDDFVKNWFWQFKNQNCIREVHMSVNTNCTFKCKNCNMFMPYYNRTFQYSLEDVERDWNLFFSRIDYVYIFSLLGGEPFLNPQLASMVKTLYQNYNEKVGRIEIISNGSLLPDQNTLQVLKECHALVRISDYSTQVLYKDRLNELCEVLDFNGIKYSVETSLQWVDFCFPENKKGVQILNPKEHMLCCAPEFHGLNDGKFYYCHVAWSAEKAGLFQLRKGDYLDLNSVNASSKIDCRKIVECSDGKIEGGYVSLCEKCMGCGPDNDKFIPVGEQMVKRN